MLKAKNFIPISDNPFSRRGSYLALFCATDGHEMMGKAKLFLGNLRGNGPYRQIQAEIIKDGHTRPSVIDTTESEGVT